jgi:hypothetical protein
VSWHGGWQASDRGRRPRLCVRVLRRRSLERLSHTRGVLPRGQDRLPSVGHEDRPHQPQRRGPLRPRRGRAHGLTPDENRISLAAPSHLIRRGLRLSPVLLCPRAVRQWGRGRNSRGPRNARHPRFDFSEDCKLVRGCYEPALGSLPASWAAPSANHFTQAEF